MKKLFYPLLCAAFLAGCSSKKEDPTPPPPVTTTSTGPASVSVVRNSGAVVAGAVLAVNDYGQLRDNGGTMVHRAIIDVNLPGDQTGPLTGQVKYFLTSSEPTGAVVRLESRAYNIYDFNGTATGTLTGRKVTVGGTAHLYLSGTLQANMGPRYPSVSATFTDLKAY